MRIKTEDDLFDKIDAELNWRRTELSRYKSIILQNEKNTLILTPLLRSAIPILYAHWEGFIKETALYYFNYVSVRRLKYNELSHNFLTLYITNQFYSSTNTSFENVLSLLNFLNDEMNAQSNLKVIPEPIKTQSNLNSTVLKQIMTILGMDYNKFRGYEVLIDSKLLEARNKIAHGEYRVIEKILYDELYDIVLILMNAFRTEIQNSVTLKTYRKALPSFS